MKQPRTTADVNSSLGGFAIAETKNAKPQQLYSIILKVFFNLNDSIFLWFIFLTWLIIKEANVRAHKYRELQKGKRVAKIEVNAIQLLTEFESYSKHCTS